MKPSTGSEVSRRERSAWRLDDHLLRKLHDQLHHADRRGFADYACR